MTNSTFNFSNINVNNTESLKDFRKEKGFYKSLTLVGLHEGEIESFAEISYYATKATVYVCFWIHSPILGLYGKSGGKAGGYGYNRAEAALSSAAGKLNIGVPSWCDEKALLEEFAKYLGLEVFSVIETNS